MPVVAPSRSHDQRIRALRRANEIRVARAQLKRDLRAHRQTVVALILNPPEYIETMKAIDLLMAAPKIGRQKASRILNRCRISQSKTVGRLSTRQRNELSDEVQS